MAEWDIFINVDIDCAQCGFRNNVRDTWNTYGRSNRFGIICGNCKKANTVIVDIQREISFKAGGSND